jgi:exo-beta-1,3-glucanase (GH17 family)
MKKIVLLWFVLVFFSSCMDKKSTDEKTVINAEMILGNPNYQAICYGGYRTNSRNIQPTIEELKEDMKILAAMNIKIIRTYNVHYDEVSNLLKVITELKKENPNFEMYMMLGAWIDCKNAWTNQPLIRNENSERNAIEIEKAVALTNQYPEIIKIISVGNEAMVNWATSYFVEPKIILGWVNHLQNLKKEGQLPHDLWITSSDNFASWGGGDESYHTEDLKKLMTAVDYISMHTYPMHDTHYNPIFWGLTEEEEQLSDEEKIEKVMNSALEYAIGQYESVKKYAQSLGINKPIHIGETGWASVCNHIYGPNGSKAVDEYKAARFYHLIREWTNKNKISCFYFEAFDENWKDSANSEGSENHFGLITLNAEAKYAIWDLVDRQIFDGLTRNGKKITKTYQGSEETLWQNVKVPNPFVKLPNETSK